MKLTDLHLERRPGGYLVQAEEHLLWAHQTAMSCEWRCSCGFVATSDDDFDPFHLALRMYAERQELRSVVLRFLRKEIGHGALRAVIGALK